MMPADALFERQLRAEVRTMENAELIDHRERLRLTDYPTDDECPGVDVERCRNELRLRCLDAEHERRLRLSRTNSPSIIDRTFKAWTDTAREIRERCDLPMLFDHLGYSLKPAGRNGRRNADEWSGSCPLCAGTDRLRVWAGSNGRAWCRICGWSADAILAARSLDRSIDGFYPAVRFLADLLGIPLPEDDPMPVGSSVVPDPAPAEVVTFPSGLTFMPVRRGGRRAG
jgi:hypothetical protein